MTANYQKLIAKDADNKARLESIAIVKSVTQAYRAGRSSARITIRLVDGVEVDGKNTFTIFRGGYREAFSRLQHAKRAPAPFTIEAAKPVAAPDLITLQARADVSAAKWSQAGRILRDHVDARNAILLDLYKHNETAGVNLVWTARMKGLEASIKWINVEIEKCEQILAEAARANDRDGAALCAAHRALEAVPA